MRIQPSGIYTFDGNTVRAELSFQDVSIIIEHAFSEHSAMVAMSMAHYLPYLLNELMMKSQQGELIDMSDLQKENLTVEDIKYEG